MKKLDFILAILVLSMYSGLGIFFMVKTNGNIYASFIGCILSVIIPLLFAHMSGKRFKKKKEVKE